MEVCDLSRVRPVGDGKESSPAGGNVEIRREEDAENVEELKRLKKDLEVI